MCYFTMLKNSSSDILEFITAFLIAADITRAASVPAKLISTCTASLPPRFAVLAAGFPAPVQYPPEPYRWLGQTGYRELWPDGPMAVFQRAP